MHDASRWADVYADMLGACMRRQIKSALIFCYCWRLLPAAVVTAAFKALRLESL